MWLYKKSQCAILAFQNDRKLEKKLDNGEKVGVIFMDLSKAFDMINHSLLLAKLQSFCFSDQVLRLLQSYIYNIIQKSLINGSFSSWNEVITRSTSRVNSRSTPL